MLSFNMFILTIIIAWVEAVALWLGYTNSMLNPIIYGVLHRQHHPTEEVKNLASPKKQFFPTKNIL